MQPGHDELTQLLCVGCAAFVKRLGKVWAPDCDAHQPKSIFQNKQLKPYFYKSELIIKIYNSAHAMEIQYSKQHVSSLSGFPQC